MSAKTKTRQPHRQVRLNYLNEIVEIDEELASLIQATWKAGIGTIMCCQEFDDGIAWIEFESMPDLLKLVNIVIRYDGDSIYNRVHTQFVDGIQLPV